MDHFMEEVVVKHNRGFQTVMYYLSNIVMVLAAIMGLMGVQFLFVQFSVFALVEVLIWIGIAVGLFLYRDRLRTEYEYTFTNGSLDFAMVFNNRKRKPLGSLNVAKVDAFGKVESGSFHRHSNTPGIKHLRWFLNREAELYYFVFSKNGQKSLLVFEPSEEMVGYIKHYLPYGAHQEN